MWRVLTLGNPGQPIQEAKGMLQNQGSASQQGIFLGTSLVEVAKDSKHGV